jgi:ATP-dependent RNA helicase DDX23/PRP28
MSSSRDGERERKRSRHDGGGSGGGSSSDVGILKPETEEELEMAARMARIAARAEAKAAGKKMEPATANELAKEKAEKEKVVFMTKAQRQAAALARMEERRKQIQGSRQDQRQAHDSFVRGDRHRERQRQRRDHEREEAREAREKNTEKRKAEDEIRRFEKEKRERGRELAQIKESYIGTKVVKKRVAKPSEKFAKIFQFDWEASDDTGASDLNDIYKKRCSLQPLFGRGYLAGMDMRQQRQDHGYMEMLTKKRQDEARRAEDTEKLSRDERKDRERKRQKEMDRVKQLDKDKKAALNNKEEEDMGVMWKDKKLEEMNDRDWRIFREDFNIRIKGGRAPLPLRTWDEGKLSDPVMKAIKSMGYKEPSAIQRQVRVVCEIVRSVLSGVRGLWTK